MSNYDRVMHFSVGCNPSVGYSRKLILSGLRVLSSLPDPLVHLRESLYNVSFSGRNEHHVGDPISPFD